MARFGSLRSRATPARVEGSQYLCTSVSSGKLLSSSAASFSAPAASPARARASAAITRTSRFGATFNAARGRRVNGCRNRAGEGQRLAQLLGLIDEDILARGSDFLVVRLGLVLLIIRRFDLFVLLLRRFVEIRVRSRIARIVHVFVRGRAGGQIRVRSW